jgi:hypothetical protein
VLIFREVQGVVAQLTGSDRPSGSGNKSDNSLPHDSKSIKTGVL